MKRILSTLVLAGSLVTASACGTESTSPIQQPVQPTVQSSDLLGLPLTDLLKTVTGVVAGQTWLVAPSKPITVSVNVSPTQGGLLTIPLLGVVVTIPKGAVDKPTTITMTALAGDVVALDFAPHGTKFKAPLKVVQNMLFTNWLGQSFDVVYFKANTDINEKNNTITYSEVIPVGMIGPVATYNIWHFSGYATAAGRAAAAE